MKVLGVTCSADCAFFAVAQDGLVVDAAPHRLRMPLVHEASARLAEAITDCRRAVAELRPSCAAILAPEPISRFSYNELAPRVALETVIRLACVHEGVSVELLPRPTVRARLNLPRSGRLGDHVSCAVGQPVGPYWNAGRKLAALAALGATEEP